MKDTNSNNTINNNNKKTNDRNGKISPFMFLIFVFVVTFVWIFPVDDMVHIFSDAKDEESSVVYEITETEEETEEESETTTEMFAE